MKKLILIGLPGSGKTTVGGLLAGGGSLETLRRQREALYRICADYTIREDTAQAAAEAIAAIWRKQT